VLRAEAAGNGVTGLVAATGTSYLCHDTATDPHYIQGAAGARSSMTVPLLLEDQVVGTFNVESPRPNGFSEQDLQFTEIFGREIAMALHTLELLTAQRYSATSQSIDAVRCEVAMPLDDILAAAAALLARPGARDLEVSEQLRRIADCARAVKGCITRVGDDLAPPKPGEADATRLRGKRVLVVDADDRTRWSAHSILEKFGATVEAARTGSEAVAMALHGGYDAVLIDIRLPDLKAYDAYTLLRATLPQARLALMTVFGYDSSHSIVKARQDGLRTVLFKPFRVDQLLNAVDGPEPAANAKPQPASVSG
jgi:two-component system, sensor histidine kinase SagS